MNSEFKLKPTQGTSGLSSLQQTATPAIVIPSTSTFPPETTQKLQNVSDQYNKTRENALTDFDKAHQVTKNLVKTDHLNADDIKAGFNKDLKPGINPTKGPMKDWKYTSHYTYEAPNGQKISVKQMWDELNRCFNCNFPLNGAPEKLPALQEHLPLYIKEKIIIDDINSKIVHQSMPVRVSDLSYKDNIIHIQYTTLKGHLDGEGSTIDFTITSPNGVPTLKVVGDIKGGITALPIVDNPITHHIYVDQTKADWQEFINNLGSNSLKYQS